MNTAQIKPGFTIVELLIVIVVIAILAAISIVAYTGIQNSANDAAVQSDLRSLMTKVEVMRAETGQYPTSPTAITGFSASRGAYAMPPMINSNLNGCFNPANRDVFGFIAMSKSGKIFRVSNSAGLSEFNGSWEGNMCVNMGGGFTNAYAGYTGSEWRAWAGGN